MRVLVWHVHGAYTTAFVQGGHTYLVPVLPDRGPDGRGRADTYPWPDTVQEVTPESLRENAFDVVVLQRPHEVELVERWSGRRPGRDVPAVYLEHNTPRGDVDDWVHPMAARGDVPVVHVTEWNAAMYTNGAAPVHVIEHGIPDPGHRYTGERESLAVCVNEPVRRWRVAGTDLAARVSGTVRCELYGLGLAGVERRWAEVAPGGLLAAHENPPQALLHRLIPRHRAYLHPYRWTSLGLALIEAMTLGMPVLVLAATAAPTTVPPQAGLVTADVSALAAMAAQLVADPAEARARGRAARTAALARHGLARFLDDWDRLFKEVC